MEDLKNRSFILSIDTQDVPTLNAWNSMVAKLNEDKTELVHKWATVFNYDKPGFTNFKTAMQIHGSNDLYIKTYDLLESDLPDPVKVKAAMINTLFYIFKLNWKGWTPTQELNFRTERSLLRCMERDVRCEEVQSLEIRGIDDLVMRKNK